ncbi:Uncharacterized protein APZ42_008333, partial [Daphnia magna]
PQYLFFSETNRHVSEHGMAQNGFVRQKHQAFKSPSDTVWNLNYISTVLQKSFSTIPCPAEKEELWDRIIHYIGLGYSVKKISQITS